MRRRRALGCVLLGAALANALGGCASTLDSLGTDLTSNAGSAGSAGLGMAASAGAPPVYDTLKAVKGPDTYYNAFKALLGKTDAQIADKLRLGFAQLFHPNAADAATQAIYNEQGDDQALIYDALHNDVRTEGIGLAMIITVELDKQDEFDRLWRYAKAVRQQTSGPAQGYFNSFCGEDAPGTACFDSYGMQHFVLALMLANGRWQSTPEMPYATDALALLDLLQNKEARNGGVVMGIGSAFDARTHLVREEPTLADAGFTTRSALEMPAAYWYWGQATGNPFWSTAAVAAREHLLKAADSKTGLWPMRSYFDGSPVEGSPGFTAQAYRTQLNLALDALWGTAGTGQGELADRLLAFFDSKGPNSATFSIDGTALDNNRAEALISVNGALAIAASGADANRKDFADAVWSQPIPSGDNRYYDGLLYLMSLLVLSGQLQVY